MLARIASECARDAGETQAWTSGRDRSTVSSAGDTRLGRRQFAVRYGRTMLTVGELWRYPVKSLGGERLEAAHVDERGIEGDRAWGIHDPETGMVLTARREPALLFLSARLVDGRPVITCDEGHDLSTDDALSRWMGRSVRLRSAVAGPATFENPMNTDDESDWVRWQSTGDTFHDGRSKISMVTRESLGEWDARRFRLNLILDGDAETPIDGEIAVGSAVLSIRKPIDRCVMVSRAQPGLAKDATVLKRIIHERDNKMGVGAVITRAGTISVDDAFA